jgi:hypothetical protein
LLSQSHHRIYASFPWSTGKPTSQYKNPDVVFPCCNYSIDFKLLMLCHWRQSRKEVCRARLTSPTPERGMSVREVWPGIVL